MLLAFPSVAVIEVAELGNRHGDLVAVSGISLAIEEGEVVFRFVPNGAGKTTAVEILGGASLAGRG